MIKQFWRIFLILLPLIIPFSDANAFEFRDYEEYYKVGDIVKDFTLPYAMSKEHFSFNRDVKGVHKATAILFMTTTCSACKAEMVLLSDFVNEYGNALKVYAVSVDLDGENTIPAYEKEYEFGASYLLDPDFTVPQQFGFIYTPGLIIVNKKGEITYMKGGYSPANAQEVIDALKVSLK